MKYPLDVQKYLAAVKKEMGDKRLDVYEEIFEFANDAYRQGVADGIASVNIAERAE